MKKTLLIAAAALTAAGMLAFSTPKKNTPPAATLTWYSWEEATALNQKQPKKIFVDVYTDWCGWCKKMDKSTFSDPAVAAYLAEHFYPVKFNAEQRANIDFNGQTFKFLENQGRGGAHELAVALLDGRMGYPSFVFLNEKYERIMISPGYKEPADILKELRFAAEGHYLKTSWEEYMQRQ